MNEFLLYLVSYLSSSCSFALSKVSEYISFATFWVWGILVFELPCLCVVIQFGGAILKVDGNVI